MLETFSLAPEVTAFDLGCLDHKTGRMSFRKTWDGAACRPPGAGRGVLARFFTRKAAGDPGAVRRAQLGHLPGTTNRTPAAAGDGPASFVVLRSRSSAAVTPIPSELARSAGLRPGGEGS